MCWRNLKKSVTNGTRFQTSFIQDHSVKKKEEGIIFKITIRLFDQSPIVSSARHINYCNILDEQSVLYAQHSRGKGFTEPSQRMKRERGDR